MEEELARKFEAYLEGSMPTQEREAFAQVLAGDAALTARLREEEAADQVVKAAGREELRGQLTGFEAEWQAQGPTVPSSRYWRWGGALAITLGLLALLGWWVCLDQTSEPEGVFAAHFSAYPPPPRTRGRAPEMAANWEKAATAYGEENYAAAANLFTAVTSDSTLAYLAHFYTGVSLLAQEPPRGKEAITALELALRQDSDYRPAARWYLALAYLEEGEKAAAEPLLAAIVRDRSFQFEAAAAILRTLED